jgi:hypothetical protein
MTDDKRVVDVRFSLGSYVFMLVSVIFVLISFWRYGHVFWWVYPAGALLGLLVIPIFFFVHTMRNEYDIHHETHGLENIFFDESTDGTVALDVDVENPEARAHIEYNRRLGALTFKEWLKLAFTEGIGHTKLTIRDTVVPVIKQSALFSIITGMVSANILLVIWIIVAIGIFKV